MLPLYNHILILLEIFIFTHIRIKHPEEKFLFISSIQLTLLLALRGIDVGNDTVSYHKDIIYVSEGLDVGFETGDVILINFIYSLTSDIQAVIAIYAIFTVLFIILGIKHSSCNKYISVALYSGLIYYNFAFSGMRQALALSLVTYSFTFLFEKNYLKSIGFITAAFFFHQSSIIAMIAVFFDYFRHRFKTTNILLFFGLTYVFLMVFTNNLISIGVTILPEYAWYINGYAMVDVSYVNLLFYMTLLYISMQFATRLSISYEQRELIIRYIIILGIGVAFYVMATQFRLVNRITMYFTIVVIYLIPSIIENSRNKKALFIIIILMSLVYFLVLVYIGANKMVPYNFFWN